MELIDTHCHIQEAGDKVSEDEFVGVKWRAAGFTSPGPLIDEAVAAGVNSMLAIGNTLRDSRLAIELAGQSAHVWASIGVHPHEAKDHLSARIHDEFASLATKPRVVAVGECGLDYFYSHSPRKDQVKLLEFQLQVAEAHHLPVIFHVRDAFEDFWPIFDQFKSIQGVIHSFTADIKTLDQALSRDLHIGLNGIMTFTKNADQLAAAKKVPLDRLLLETDAPFLTPDPFRGTICRPKHVVRTAEFLSDLRGESLESLAEATTRNAKLLFNL